MKTGEEAVISVVSVLQELNIPYMLVGSFSSNFYGIGRATKDADLIVVLKAEDRKAFLAKLPAEFRVDPQVSFEMVTGTTRQKLSVPSLPFMIELFDLSADEFDRARFSRRVLRNTLERQIFLPTAEDVIVQKLRWHQISKRAKDFEDTVSVIAVQDATLDWSYIRKWCGVHGTLELLERARQEAFGGRAYPASSNGP